MGRRLHELVVVALVAIGGFGCFGFGDRSETLPENFEPHVVLADSSLLLGGDGGMSGWRVSSGAPDRFAPMGEGAIVAADVGSDGVVAISQAEGGRNSRLWSHSATGWSGGTELSHGPINQLMVTPSGALWTEGDRGVFQSVDRGVSWTSLSVPRSLRLGARKLGRSGDRIAYAGPELMVTTDEGQSWTTIDAGDVVTTDGTWVVSTRGDDAMRVGQIVRDDIVWTDEVKGAWNPSAVRASAHGVRILATRRLSTQVELLQGDVDGRGFVSTKLKTQPEWVGLGERVLWLDSRNRVRSLP